MKQFVRIEPLSLEPYHEVLHFECENKPYFERWLEPKSESFYQSNTIKHSLEHFMQLSEQNLEHHFFAWLGSDLIGRLALRDCDNRPCKQAALGYRFSQRFLGRGYATDAVKQVLQVASNALKMQRIYAIVNVENARSIGVLTRCGFNQYRVSYANLDHLYFEYSFHPR